MSVNSEPSSSPGAFGRSALRGLIARPWPSGPRKQLASVRGASWITLPTVEEFVGEVFETINSCQPICSEMTLCVDGVARGLRLEVAFVAGFFSVKGLRTARAISRDRTCAVN